MGKRYYCDYCDKTFPDNLDQRKKHLKGVSHQRNRNQFYQSLQISMWTGSSQASANSRLTGQELLQQWLARHPEVVKRAATELKPDKRVEQTQLSKMRNCDAMKKGYTSVTGMKYPPEVAQELANVTDLPPSLLCSS